MARKIGVEIVGDSRSLERAFGRSSRAAKQWQRDMAGVLGGRGGAAGLARSNVYGAAALAAGAAFVKTTQAASDLNEEITRSQVVFGSSADSIQAWARTTATSFGISEREALRAASSYGAMLRTIGNTPAAAESMSRRLVELAGDLSSFNNQDPTDMLDRLRSGLAGEIEPLRQFGILLSESRVKTEAYASGITKAGAKLTEQQKVQARYQILLRDSALAQGDFARTSENLANQQRILRAQLLNLEASIGKVLLPTMIVLVSTANDLITAFGTAGGAADTLTEKVGGLGGVIGNVLSQIPGLTAGVAAIEAAQRIAGRGGGGGAVLVRGESAADKAASAAANQITPADVRRARATAEQRNEWFDALVGRREDRVQDIRSMQGQIAELRGIARLIQARIDVTKDVTRRLTLEDELLGVQRQIRGIEEASRERTKQLRAEGKALAEERRERERTLREAGQFAALGFGPGGADLVPGVSALRKRFARVTDALRGTQFEGKLKSRMARIAAVLAGSFGEVTEAVRAKIETMLADIDRMLGERRRRRQNFRAVGTDDMLRGLGLSPQEIQALRGRLAATSGGRAPKGGRAAFGTSLSGATVVNIHGDVVTPNADKFVRDMQKRAKRSRPQQRGVRPGGNLGLA